MELKVGKAISGDCDPLSRYSMESRDGHIMHEELPDELYNWLKKEAKERGITLRELVIELLERALQMEKEKQKLESLTEAIQRFRNVQAICLHHASLSGIMELEVPYAHHICTQLLARIVREDKRIGRARTEILFRGSPGSA